LKVLIADDDSLIRTMLGDVLADLGHTVVSATNGQEALDLFKSERPDAVFLDFLMPKMNGLDALKAIRASGNRTPVVLLTAISDHSMKSLGPSESPDAFLEKPFRPKTVEKTLAKVARSA
jgi:two-component system, response regulator PdtaR